LVDLRQTASVCARQGVTENYRFERAAAELLDNSQAALRPALGAGRTMLR